MSRHTPLATQTETPVMDPVVVFDPTIHTLLLPQLASIHHACITEDLTVATFLPPLDHAKMLQWWEARAREVSSGERVILFARTTHSAIRNDLNLTGVVTMSTPSSETGPFRAWVEKLLVSPRFRRLGIARMLMLKLEEVGMAMGRTLLLLDTETGSPAEDIYPRLGYIRVGIIPNYEISPGDGQRHNETFFYKDLRTTV